MTRLPDILTPDGQAAFEFIRLCQQAADLIETGPIGREDMLCNLGESLTREELLVLVQLESVLSQLIFNKVRFSHG